jgi:beta-phosphoglucomutase-like phosphatase (HAD superfamily)
VTSEEYENRKPKPDAYLTAARLLEADPKDCLVIEDSEVGVEAAKAAGMKCIVALNHYYEKSDFPEADLIVKHDELSEEVFSRL